MRIIIDIKDGALLADVFEWVQELDEANIEFIEQTAIEGLGLKKNEEEVLEKNGYKKM